MTTIEILLPNGETKTYTGHHIKWNHDGTLLFLYPGASDDTLESISKTGGKSFSLLAIPVMAITTD